jgi:arsenate reductase-like glutaredoxin family protein
LRKNEQIYKNLDLRGISLSVDETIDIIFENPILLQRPIIAKYEYNKLVKAMIARPPKKVLSILD